MAVRFASSRVNGRITVPSPSSLTQAGWHFDQSVMSPVPEADLFTVLRTITYLNEFWKLLLLSLLNIRTFISCIRKKHSKVRNSLPKWRACCCPRSLKEELCRAPLKPSDRREDNQREEVTCKVHGTRPTHSPARSCSRCSGLQHTV